MPVTRAGRALLWLNFVIFPAAILALGLNRHPLTLPATAAWLLSVWLFGRVGIKRSTGLCPDCVETINDPQHDWLEA